MRRKTNVISYRPRRKKRKKKKTKLVLLLVFLSAILLSLLSYIVWRQFFYQPTIKASNSIWGESLELDSALVFDVEMVSAIESGLLHHNISEGETVKSGQVIATIIDEQRAHDLQQKINELKTELEKYSVIDDSEGNEIVTGEVGVMRNQLRNLIYNYSLYRMFRDENGMNKSFNELDTLVKDFYDTKLESDQDQEQYQELKKQLAIAEADYDHCKQEIIAGYNGVISYQIGKLTEVLNPEKFPLENYNWFTKQPEVSSVTDGSKVDSGQNIIKLLRTDKWWAIVRIPQNKSDRYLKAEEFELEVLESLYKAKYMFHNQFKKDLYFYFEVEQAPKLLERFAKVVLSTEEIECMELPIKSIEFEKESSYVYVKKGRISEKTEVKILRKFEDTVLIEQLDGATEIIADISFVRR